MPCRWQISCVSRPKSSSPTTPERPSGNPAPRRARLTAILKPGPPESGVSATIVTTCSGGGSRSMTLLTSMQMLPPQRIPLRAIVLTLQDGLGDGQIVLQCPQRLEMLLLQLAVI